MRLYPTAAACCHEQQQSILHTTRVLPSGCFARPPPSTKQLVSWRGQKPPHLLFWESFHNIIAAGRNKVTWEKESLVDFRVPSIVLHLHTRVVYGHIVKSVEQGLNWWWRQLQLIRVHIYPRSSMCVNFGGKTPPEWTCLFLDGGDRAVLDCLFSKKTVK